MSLFYNRRFSSYRLVLEISHARKSECASGDLVLGLTLVRTLVELQGGTLSCGSEGLSKEIRFTVTLPGLFVEASHAAMFDRSINATPRCLFADRDCRVQCRCSRDPRGGDIAAHGRQVAVATMLKAR